MSATAPDLHVSQEYLDSQARSAALRLMSATAPDLHVSQEYLDSQARSAALRRRANPQSEDDGKWFSRPTAGEVAAQAALLGLIGLDWAQTRDFRSRGIREVNPALGSYPSRARVNVLVPLGAAAVTLGAYALPRKYRRALQALALTGEGLATINNYAKGYGPQL